MLCCESQIFCSHDIEPELQNVAVFVELIIILLDVKFFATTEMAGTDNLNIHQMLLKSVEPQRDIKYQASWSNISPTRSV